MYNYLKNESTYFTNHPPESDKTIYGARHFGGAETYFNFRKENDPQIPTKGILFGATANYIQNLKENSKHINRYTALFGFYIPFSRAISWASRAGVATVEGKPEFYQLAIAYAEGGEAQRIGMTSPEAVIALLKINGKEALAPVVVLRLLRVHPIRQPILLRLHLLLPLGTVYS